MNSTARGRLAVLTAFVVLLVSGCAQKTWHHMNPQQHTQANLEQDKSACVESTESVMGEPNGEYGSPAYNLWRIQYNNEFKQCMRGRGWLWQ